MAASERKVRKVQSAWAAKAPSQGSFNYGRSRSVEM